MKLGKTQVELLNEAAKSRVGRGCVSTGHVSYTKGSRYGIRRADALNALLRLGLVAVINQTSSLTPMGRGKTLHASDRIFTLTENGTKALANLKA